MYTRDAPDSNLYYPAGTGTGTGYMDSGIAATGQFSVAKFADSDAHIRAVNNKIFLNDTKFTRRHFVFVYIQCVYNLHLQYGHDMAAICCVN